jgi:calcyphosin
LLEFLETFDVGGEVDGKVTLSEFENYYANISASIDDDDYFELMIRNAWHISGGEGWCANSSNRRVLVTDASGNQRVEEIRDDLGLRADDKTGMMARLRAQGASVSNIDLYSGGDHGIGGKPAPPRSAPNRRGVSKAFAHETTSSTSFIPSTGYLSKGNEVKLNRPGSAGYQNLSKNVSNQLSRPPAVDSANIISYNHPSLESLRKQLKARGANGISGLSRAFRRMDFDGSKSLSYEEFSRALSESGLAISEPEKRRLFVFFDRDRGGSVDYNEFLVGIRGSLNDRRKKFVKMAFEKFDRDGNGVVDVQDIIGVYDASKHPDVISGRRTAGQILMEFIEGFDVGGEVDGKVTLSEFENYYANISASIDDDDYFELMIRNAWHISGGEGWCANSSNRRVLVTDASGNQRVEEIRDDLGLRADDKTGMMARLRAQGVDVSNINLTSAIDETRPSKGMPPSKYGRPESASRDFEPSNPRGRPNSSRGGSSDREESRYQPKREGKDVFPGMELPNGLGLTP